MRYTQAASTCHSHVGGFGHNGVNTGLSVPEAMRWLPSKWKDLSCGRKNHMKKYNRPCNMVVKTHPSVLPGFLVRFMCSRVWARCDEAEGYDFPCSWKYPYVPWPDQECDRWCQDGHTPPPQLHITWAVSHMCSCTSYGQSRSHAQVLGKDSGPFLVQSLPTRTLPVRPSMTASLMVPWVPPHTCTLTLSPGRSVPEEAW